MRGWVLWVSLFVALCVEYAQCNDDQLKLSPYDQRLPECSEDYPRVVKNTTEKAILCPMIRNEEGFLAEWIAYYQMHGFDHIMLFDDGSTDSFAEEIEPWVSAGIVSVRSNWTMESLQIAPGFTRNEFKRRMTTKQLLERVCKKQAQEWGYRYFVSLDLDEFIVVKVTPVSIVDSIHDWFQQSGKAAFLIEKYNFASVPHLLEPVNLLQIEAYQSRMRDLRRMSYYTSVMPKIVLQLQGGNNYDENTQEYLATCCHFHGCHGHDPLKDSKFCSQQDGNQKGIMKKGSHPPHNLVINHYSRSLEKYTIKAATWSTASGEVKAGESDEAAASNYDINKFFQRNLGWQIDRTALKYSCQLRETLYKMQKTRPFMRAGTVWYRNAEFGRHVSIPDKRGRYGRPNPEGFHYKDGNPYQYHGSNQLETNLGKNDEKLFAGVQQKIDLVGGVEKRENKNQEGRR
eukprot:GSChrysophyteH1.ASY1.ANO1.42.1 assembled CDS